MYLIILLVAIEYETFKTPFSGVQWWCFAPLPSIMNCLLSKLEELLTNKYSGLISDQQNNKWREDGFATGPGRFEPKNSEDY